MWRWWYYKSTELKYVVLTVLFWCFIYIFLRWSPLFSAKYPIYTTSYSCVQQHAALLWYAAWVIYLLSTFVWFDNINVLVWSYEFELPLFFVLGWYVVVMKCLFQPSCLYGVPCSLHIKLMCYIDKFKLYQYMSKKQYYYVKNICTFVPRSAVASLSKFQKC